MFRRLALALLILCLALPATAMSAMAGPSPCHETGMTKADMVMADMAKAGHHQQERKTAPAAPAGHDCIGCIAPYTGAPAAFTAPPTIALPPTAALMAPISGAERLPEIPPPRT